MVIFQRRHYYAIAEMIAHNQMGEDIISTFCHQFRKDNSKFDEERFREWIRHSFIVG